MQRRPAVVHGVVPGEHSIEEIKNVIYPLFVVIPEPDLPVVDVHCPDEGLPLPAVRVIFHDEQQLRRKLPVRFSGVAAYSKARGFVVEPRCVRERGAVDIHAVRQYHRSPFPQHGEALRHCPEESERQRRGNEPAAL